VLANMRVLELRGAVAADPTPEREKFGGRNSVILVSQLSGDMTGALSKLVWLQAEAGKIDKSNAIGTEWVNVHPTRPSLEKAFWHAMKFPPDRSRNNQ